MSLDIYLTIPGAQLPVEQDRIYIRADGQTKPISRAEWDARHPGQVPVTVHYDYDTTDEVYTANITHNLSEMARHAGLYGILWHPETCGIVTAQDLAQPLRIGLEVLLHDPVPYLPYSPANGWGTYRQLAAFVEGVLEACTQYPTALVHVSI